MIAVALLESHLFASNFSSCLCTLIGLCGCRLQLVLSLYLRPQHQRQHTISAFEWQLAFAELCIAFRLESKINCVYNWNTVVTILHILINDILWKENENSGWSLDMYWMLKVHSFKRANNCTIYWARRKTSFCCSYC